MDGDSTTAQSIVVVGVLVGVGGGGRGGGTVGENTKD